MLLILGNKNYSTWSLRGWLMLEKSGVNYDEKIISLVGSGFYKEVQQYTPALKVPALVDGDVQVWDSLAICEYINDAYMSGEAWPTDAKERAKARSLAAEMHSGFHAIRSEMPMNIRATRKVELSEQAKLEIARIEQIWSEQSSEFKNKGGWLFGSWSIADVMFAPVALRFKTYQIEIGAEAQRYADHVLSCSAIQKWIEEALLEDEVVPQGEAGQEL
ncbi:putative Glutathione S-transferase [Vibrio nigripulchritudo SOn1]|uniref:Glutathione S-transferase n=1 Tax=Vibrio nigripulchritudo SOn1 TaxID=1238450 RepID=A0AAV2VQV3_9VIBR|nr:glutathione S-transferase family protein [Vibrio nigripulchritudo]CCO47096.1 putative Glutathione S-transferase [Vibrio nigripulchritudo SOn1]